MRLRRARNLTNSAPAPAAGTGCAGRAARTTTGPRPSQAEPEPAPPRARPWRAAGGLGNTGGHRRRSVGSPRGGEAGPAALLPAAHVAGSRQAPGGDLAAGFRAGHPEARAPVAAIGGLIGWWIPRLTAAHCLISLTIDVLPDARI